MRMFQKKIVPLGDDLFDFMSNFLASYEHLRKRDIGLSKQERNNFILESSYYLKNILLLHWDDEFRC